MSLTVFDVTQNSNLIISMSAIVCKWSKRSCSDTLLSLISRQNFHHVCTAFFDYDGLRDLFLSPLDNWFVHSFKVGRSFGLFVIILVVLLFFRVVKRPEMYVIDFAY